MFLTLMCVPVNCVWWSVWVRARVCVCVYRCEHITLWWILAHICAQCSLGSIRSGGGGLKEDRQPSGRLQMWGYWADRLGPLWAYVCQPQPSLLCSSLFCGLVMVNSKRERHFKLWTFKNSRQNGHSGDFWMGTHIQQTIALFGFEILITRF